MHVPLGASGVDLSSNQGNKVLRTFDVFMSMNGLRYDTGKWLIPWIPLLALSLWISTSALKHGFLMEFAIVSWVVYYFGQTIMLGTPIKRWMIDKMGEDNAWGFFQMYAGCNYFNIGSGITAAAIYQQDAFALSTNLAWGIAGILFLIGFGCKFWATWLVGSDVYYYKDLFYEKSHGEWCDKGIYKWFRNPMYGIGYLHSYSLAIIFGSYWGLAYAASCHVGIYIFHMIVEVPFIKRTYLTSDA